MGNDASQLYRYDIACFFRKQDWLRVSISPRFQLWKHKYTQEIAEVYMLEKAPTLRDMECYQFRSKQTDLVKVFFIDINQDATLCDTNNRVRLIVEHIPYRLADITNFTQQQGLTVLEAAFKGFRLIEREFGPLDPKEELIGFNSQGKTKVWLNRHIELNNIETQQSHYEGKSQDQTTRINQLYLMIQQKTVGDLLPTHLKQQLLTKALKYDEALAIIRRFAYSCALSLSRAIDKDFREERTVKNSSYLKHTRQNTNTSLETKYNQLNNLQFSRKQSVASFQQIPKINSITHIDKRFDSITRYKEKSFNQASLFFRAQVLSSDYSFCNTITSRAMPIASPTKVSSIHTNPPIQASPTSNELMKTSMATQRKYTIIQKIENDQSVLSEIKDKEDKRAQDSALEVITAKEVSFDQRVKQEAKQAQIINIQKDSIEYPQQQSIQTSKIQNYQQIEGYHQDCHEVHRVKRIQSLDYIQYTNILPQFAEQKKVEINRSQKEQRQEQKNIAVTPKQVKAVEQDFLDINFLQKSLDRKFKHHNNKVEPAPIEDDMFNIAKLQEGLIKFQNSQKDHQKQSPSVVHSSNSQDGSNKIIDYQAEVSNQMTFKYLEAHDSLPHHKQPRTIDKFELQTQPVQSSYFQTSRPYKSIRTEPNMFQFSFSSFSLQPNTYEKIYSYQSKRLDNLTWSNQDLTIKNQNHRQRKYNSRTDLQEKYLKHVKSKDKLAKPKRTREGSQLNSQQRLLNSQQRLLNSQQRLLNSQQRLADLNELRVNYGMKSVRGVSEKVGSGHKITYQDLRSLLRTDL